MGSITSPKYQFLYALLFLQLIQTRVFCIQYKVGDLDSWGIPTSAKPNVYITWSNNHIFNIGDSLMFLYPPSQDSVIQVTAQSFSSCTITNPILTMNDGNSLFNITQQGYLYFTSGVQGHCHSAQRLRIAVGVNGSAAYPPLPGPDSSASSPSYPTVFGSIPMPPSSSPSSSAPLSSLSSSSSSSSSMRSPVISVSAAIGLLVFGLVMN